MKFNFATITLGALVFFTARSGFAESLNCTEAHSFRTANMSINRDGSIGFDGTYINLQASWFFQTGFENLGQLTGRKSDEKLNPSGLYLYLSPKGACTKNNDSLSENFSCEVKNGQIDVVGTEYQQINDGSAVTIEEATKQLRVNVNIALDAKIQVLNKDKRSIQMTALITNAKTGQQIKLNENMECTLENK